MTDSITARAMYLMRELSSLRGFIPAVARIDFATLGARLDRTFYAPEYVRPVCTATTRAGSRCRNHALDGYDICGIHDSPPVVHVPKPKCARDGCNITAFRGVDVCWRHGRKEGTIDAPPTECAICYDDMKSVVGRKKTPCGHYFHKTCLAIWSAASPSYRPPCPMCRRPLRRIQGVE
jgi:hypothetical protein